MNENLPEKMTTDARPATRAFAFRLCDRLAEAMGERCAHLEQRLLALEAAVGVKAATKPKVRMKGSYVEGQIYGTNDAVRFGDAWYVCASGPTALSPTVLGVWRRI
jgi:hypothetical protein